MSRPAPVPSTTPRSVGGAAVAREIWPYKPVAHSPARR